MPGSNIEAIVNQKLQGMELEPAPADWDAIYERLHPKKRRRIIFWWWLPLAGALLLGGGYYALKGSGSGSDNGNGNTAIVDQSGSSGDANASATPETTTSQPSDALQAPAASDDANASASSSPSSSNDVTSPSSSATGTSGNKGGTTGGSIASGKKANPSAAPLAGLAAGKKKTSGTSNSGRKNKGSKAGRSASGAPLASTDQTAGAVGAQVWPWAVVDNNIERSMPATEKKLANNSLLKTDSIQEVTAIPNTSTHKNKGWYLGVYGGAGLNNMSNKTGNTKSVNAGSSAIPGSNSYNQTYGAMSNGTHIEAGAVLQKKYKKFEWSIGVGMQRNTWSQDFNLTRDSIQPSGALYSSTQMATKETRYEHVAVELPLMAGFRISEKGPNSFWVNAGINNAFTVYTKELDYKISGNVPAGAFTDPLTSAINKYNPQLRFGITYNHAAAKYHWQLAPFMQYGLNSVIESGTPDLRMMHIGLQFRYFLFKLR